MRNTQNGTFDHRHCRPCRKYTKHVLAYNWKDDAETPKGTIPRLECWVCTRCGFAANMTGSDQTILIKEASTTAQTQRS